MIGGMLKGIAIVIGITVALLVVAVIAAVTVTVACCKWGVDEYKRRVNAEIPR